jgi:hypothetical protein
MIQMIKTLKWIRRNYRTTYRQRKFHNYNSREVARKYANKWAERNDLGVQLIIKTILLLRIDYLIIN